MEQQTSEAAEVLDTFDEGTYTEGPMDDGQAEEGTEGQEAQSSEEAPVQAEEKPEIDPDSQVNMLDEKEDTGEKEEAKGDPEKSEADGEGDKEQEAKSDGEDEDSKEDGAPAEKIRNLKAFRDGKQYEIPEDAALKMKIDGKWEKVPISELRDSYSGKVSYDEKFQSLNNEVRQFKAEKEGYEGEITEIRTHLSEVATLVKGAIDGKVSPSASMEYLLDLMGGNALQYKKAMYENMAEELDIYSQMTEAEREAYWVKQENEYLTKKQESLTKSRSEEQAQAEFQRRKSELREAHGISEEDYDSAAEDLKLGGASEEHITPENIVQAARLRPLLLEAERLLDPYKEQMDDGEFNSMSVEIATTLLEAPNLPMEEIQKLLAQQYEVESIVDTLVEKTETPQKQDVSKPNKKPDHLESFDDFEGGW